ncbi:hypothetical protein B9086_005805 [Morganella morganii subsp. morganii]|nr:hypothetical protein D8758_07505 [Morganella morganii]RNW14518.1 hypothetical protein B9086_005805 [Morganella morganii subsp. morganii]PCO28395.1 hypothetical protein CP987_07375 [Morganella morganii]PHH08409.1 hypothetical protein CRX48_07660 [Morganella morganii]RAX27339.1 hypothetical protein DQ401_00660 [Morganella morganii]
MRFRHIRLRVQITSFKDNKHGRFMPGKMGGEKREGHKKKRLAQGRLSQPRRWFLVLHVAF